MMTNIPNQERWVELYYKALFEDDTNELQARVEEAQQAIQQRTRDLWHANSNGEPIDLGERDKLDTALHFLKLLRSIGTQRKAS